LPTTNAKRPIKGSKDADFSLVYFKRKNSEIATWNFFLRSQWHHPKIPWPLAVV